MKLLNRLALTAMLLAFSLSATAWAAAPPAEDGKSDLRILYVGPNPEAEVQVPEYRTGIAGERMPELKQERMSAFKSLLEEHFNNVQAVNVEDYKVSMSDDCDVTVFDAPPPPN